MKRLFAIITAAMVLCTIADAKGEKNVSYNEKGEIIKKVPEDQLLATLKEELLNWGE